MNKKVKELVDKLNLQPHPEGGYFAETYRSSLQLNELEGFTGSRSCSTGIYFLLTDGNISHLHKIKSDEMWHFYSGSPLRVVMLEDNGAISEKRLGQNMEAGEVFQFVVPKGVWFGAEVIDVGEYSFVGCTVAPGFDFSDFELANKNNMIDKFPMHKDFLSKFCIEG